MKHMKLSLMMLALSSAVIFTACHDDDSESLRSRIISLLLGDETLVTTLIEESEHGSDLLMTYTTTGGQSFVVYSETIEDVQPLDIIVVEGLLPPFTNLFVYEYVQVSNYTPVTIVLTNVFTPTNFPVPVVPTNIIWVPTNPIIISPITNIPVVPFPTNLIITNVPIRPWTGSVIITSSG